MTSRALAQLLDRAAVPVAGTFTSFDGGRTWHDNGPLPSVAADTASLDVTVAFSAADSAFVAALVNSISGDRYGTDTRIAVWRSDNGGRSFRRPVTIARGRERDHPWLAADPSGRDLYLVWSDKGRNSLDFRRPDPSIPDSASRPIETDCGGSAVIRVLLLARV